MAVQAMKSITQLMTKGVKSLAGGGCECTNSYCRANNDSAIEATCAARGAMLAANAALGANYGKVVAPSSDLSVEPTGLAQTQRFRYEDTMLVETRLWVLQRLSVAHANRRTVWYTASQEVYSKSSQESNEEELRVSCLRLKTIARDPTGWAHVKSDQEPAFSAHDVCGWEDDHKRQRYLPEKRGRAGLTCISVDLLGKGVCSTIWSFGVRCSLHVQKLSRKEEALVNANDILAEDVTRRTAFMRVPERVFLRSEQRKAAEEGGTGWLRVERCACSMCGVETNQDCARE